MIKGIVKTVRFQDVIGGFEKENLALVPAIVALIAASYLLNRDLNLSSTIDTSKLIQIGETMATSEMVKRRFRGDTLWAELDSDDAVYEKDTLQTGSNSTLDIEFEDGSVMHLGENSLVVLDRTESQFTIDVLKGNIAAKGKGKGKLALKLGDQSVNADGDINLNVGADGAAQLSVTSGSAKIMVDGKEVDISGNQVGTFTKDGVQVKELPFKRISPSALKIHPIKNTKKLYPVKFQYDVLKPLKKIQIEFSSSQKFEKLTLVKEGSAENGSQEIIVPLKDGNIYWRLRAITETDDISQSPIWPLEVKATNKPVLISPIDNEKIFVQGKGQVTEFEWQTMPIGTSYYMELYNITPIEGRPGEFNKVKIFPKANQKSKGIENSTLSLKNLKTGLYEWKIGAKNIGFTQPMMSQIGKFQLTRILKLDQPQDITPPDGANLPYLKGRNINFSWKPVPGAAGYEITINGKEIEDPIKVVTKSPAYSWDAPGLGTFNWQVRATSDAIKPGPFAKAKVNLIEENSIRTISPKNKEEVVWIIGQRNVKIPFKWIPPKAEIGKTEIHFSKSADFASVKGRQKVKGNGDTILQMKLKGRWFWKVVTFLRDGKPYSASGPQEFIVAKKLAPVTLLSPKIDSVKETFTKKELTLKWAPIKGAEKYQLEMFITPVSPADENPERRMASVTGGRNFMIEEVNGTSFTTDELPFGFYTWKVRALDSEDQLGAEGDTGKFLMKQRLSLPPPMKVFAPQVK